ncbi:MAG: EAL domain-containing protein [Lachnospiraceae bacterium]|nr:EAL domain-containing protein [Lachnospiraceae bacterium]
MEKYKYSEEKQKFIEESMLPLAVYQFLDKRVVTIAVSKGLCDILGVESLEEAYNLLDNDMYRDTHPADRAMAENLAYRFATEGGEYNVLYRSKKGEDYHIVRAHGRHVYKENGTRLAVVFYIDEGIYGDTSEGLLDMNNIQRIVERKISEQSFTDSVRYDYLTGLPNVNFFFELAYSAYDVYMKSGDVPCMLFIDFTGMKDFNHKYGFSEGDKLICGMSDLMKEVFGTDNSGRTGGDHFVACCGLKGLEEKLNYIIEKTKDINNGMSLPVRIGVFASDVEKDEPGTACDKAKMACDSLKANRESGYAFFDKEMAKKASLRQYVLDNFETALKEGWIVPYYQPLVRTANGRVSDEEALARWIDPEMGMIVPDAFIPVLEDAKLIHKLDLYIAKKTLEKMKWQADKGFYIVPQSINLSREDFYSCDIVEEIKKIADESGIDRSKLTLEITESLVASDKEYLKREIEHFRELGFKVWLDDFGSGYSSPDILQEIKFDTIKFDMLFMRGFHKEKNSRIILSELIKMAVGLELETVVEGVEDEEQVEFLREVGCTKLQGYYYCKPIPMEEIAERNRKGIQIGFENPDETEYFDAIGKINLYDFTSTMDTENHLEKGYFNTMPMAILETDNEAMWLVRTNPTFREFFTAMFGRVEVQTHWKFENIRESVREEFCEKLLRCVEDGRNTIVNQELANERTLHIYIRRVAVNPVNKVVAFAVIVLGISEKNDKKEFTFTRVAQALSTDYIYFYYVDLKTEEFTEYGIGDNSKHLSIQRNGNNFFEQVRHDAPLALFEEDVDSFLSAFNKENILKTIDESGSFTLTYRLYINGKPEYVHLKVARIDEEGIIIGVSNIDAQMMQRQSYEKVKQEKIIYSRVAALSDDYIGIFTVNPDTEEYSLFTEYEMFKDYGIGEKGDNFFERFRDYEQDIVYKDDLKYFNDNFTKEKVLREIKKKGVFSLTYRVMLEGEPVYVCVRFAITKENNERQLIVGISDIDEQVKRDMEYVNNLTEARKEVNLDALTGVKSRHAYIDVEDEINAQIEHKSVKDFAVAVFDINGLKEVNDNLGHKAGDEHIIKGCNIICEVFRHSPVFRVGGDEFVVIAQGRAYNNIDKLMQLIADKNEENLKNGDVVVAVGMARFSNDKNVAAVFERADVLMYENKNALKAKEKALKKGKTKKS